MKKLLLRCVFLTAGAIYAADSIEVVLDDETAKNVTPSKSGVVMGRKTARLDVYDGANLNDVLYGYAKQLHMTYVYNARLTDTVVARLQSDNPWESVQTLARSFGYKIDQDESSFRFYKPSWDDKDALETVVYKARNLTPQAIADAIGIMKTSVGGVYADKTSGQVVISEVSSVMPKLLRRVEELDVADNMICIEVKLIEYQFDPSRFRGIDWDNMLGKSGLTWTFGANQSWRSILNLGGVVPAGAVAGVAPPLWAAPSAVNVDVSQFNLVWRFLNNLTKTKVLAQPKIIIPNHGSSAVLRGVLQQPIPKFGQMSQTAGGATTTEIGITGIEYKDIGTTLSLSNVNILVDRVIRCSVRPTMSSQNGTTLISGSTGNLNVNVPNVVMREYESEVLIKDGEILVLGGLFDGNEQLIETKVPILGDIPVLGYLFSSKQNTKIKRNLLLSMRATIIDPRDPKQLLALQNKAKDSMAITADDYSGDPSRPLSSTLPTARELYPSKGSTRSLHPTGVPDDALIGEGQHLGADINEEINLPPTTKKRDKN